MINVGNLIDKEINIKCCIHLELYREVSNHIDLFDIVSYNFDFDINIKYIKKWQQYIV